MPEFIDISGQKFGKVLAVKRVDDHIRPSGKRVTRYLCLCDCGKSFIAAKYDLMDGHTQTCGCSRGKAKGRGIKACVYNPVGVTCEALNCQQCGWNPYNYALHAERIKEIMTKAGLTYDKSDEREPETADCELLQDIWLDY